MRGVKGKQKVYVFPSKIGWVRVYTCHMITITKALDFLNILKRYEESIGVFKALEKNEMSFHC